MGITSNRDWELRKDEIHQQNERKIVMDDILKQYERGQIKAFTPFIGITSIISMFFTFGGFNLMATGTMQKLNAGLFAVMCGVGIYLFWNLVLRFVPRQKTALMRIIAWAVTIFGMVVIFCISSLTNMMNFRGLDALEYDLKQEIAKTTLVLDQRYQHGLSLKSLTSDLRGDTSQFRAYADEEKLQGTYSGFAGSGAVHRSFVSVAYRLETLIDEAEAFSAENETRYNAASIGLAKMRRTSLKKLPLKERARQIEVLSDEVQKNLANMDPRYVAASISRTAQALPSEIDFRVTYSRNKTIAKTQKAALGRAAEDVQQVSDKLTKIADEIASSPDIPLSRFEAKSPAKAVIIHADNYIGFWVAALCADGLPVFIVIFLSLHFYRKTDEELAHDLINHVTVEDLVRARLGQEAAHLGVLDRRSIEYYNNRAVGRLDQGDQ